MSCAARHAGPIEMRRRGDRKAQRQCMACCRGVGRSTPVEHLSDEAQRALRPWRPRTRLGQGRGTSRRRRYRAYLQSREWRERRARIIARDGGVCQQCGEDDPAKLSVHHKRYAPILGEESDDDLVTWCMPCNSGERVERLLGSVS